MAEEKEDVRESDAGVASVDTTAVEGAVFLDARASIF